MEIHLQNISKRYPGRDVLSSFSQIFENGNSYAVTGHNGSGKTTLLKIIAGLITSDTGKVVYQLDGKKMNVENVYKYIAYAGPYMEMIEEFTLIEMITFHNKLKPFYQNVTMDFALDFLNLSDQCNKQLKSFSSGIRQKIRIAMAFLSNTPVLLLDEPLSNMDDMNRDWYRQQLIQYSANRLCIIASNSNSYEYPVSAIKIDLNKI